MTTSIAGAAGGAPDLNDETFARWRDFIRATEQELRWQEVIPWRSVFGSAVVEASARNKPLLAWAMNGHPLACT